jgi:hypothetical protein
VFENCIVDASILFLSVLDTHCVVLTALVLCCVCGG